MEEGLDSSQTKLSEPNPVSSQICLPLCSCLGDVRLFWGGLTIAVEKEESWQDASQYCLCAARIGSCLPPSCRTSCVLLLSAKWACFIQDLLLLLIDIQIAMSMSCLPVQKPLHS